MHIYFRRILAVIVSMLIFTGTALSVLAEHPGNNPGMTGSVNSVTVLMDDSGSGEEADEADEAAAEETPDSGSDGQTDEPAEEIDAPETSPLRQRVKDEGYAYAYTAAPVQVFSGPDMNRDSVIYTSSKSKNIWLVTSCADNGAARVSALDADGNQITGYMPESVFLAELPSEEEILSLSETQPCEKADTPAGSLLLFRIEGSAPEAPEEPEEETKPEEDEERKEPEDPQPETPAEPYPTAPEETPAETSEGPQPETPTETPEQPQPEAPEETQPETPEYVPTASPATPTDIEEEPLPAAHRPGDYVSVTPSTRVFLGMDDNAADLSRSGLYDGMFVNNAVVRIVSIEQDAHGNTWYRVSYMYGDTFTNGVPKWTAENTVYVLAQETADTDASACTLTDYALTPDQARNTEHGSNAFSLKEISVDLGGFAPGQTGLHGSSGKDSDYPQLAKSAAHGTIYATPHYLSGYTVFCLEHTFPGPGEGISTKSPTGPYKLIDLGTYINNPAEARGVSGFQFSSRTMHAIAWVLRHTYPFMALDRSDAHNLQWTRVAGQFAIREVIKQLEGAQYVRDYWDMNSFYTFRGGAPAEYLEYARWLASSAISRAHITGAIQASNISTIASGGQYIGTVTLTTDADRIRIPRSCGYITGYSGGEDANYYYARSGDTIRVTSSARAFQITMESIANTSEEAGMLIGIPSVAIQKTIIPVPTGPYPLQSLTVTFEVKLGEIRVTKSSEDGIPLMNTMFELLNASGAVIRTGTTGTDGTAVFGSLEPGAYTVREKTPPQGYKLSEPSSQAVTVTAAATAQATFTNKRIQGRIRIVKSDGTTSRPLPGAVFNITRLSCPESDHAPDVGKVVASITSNAQGIAETGALPWGQYRIDEVGVPDGYLDPGYSKTVMIG